MWTARKVAEGDGRAPTRAGVGEGRRGSAHGRRCGRSAGRSSARRPRHSQAATPPEEQADFKKKTSRKTVAERGAERPKSAARGDRGPSPPTSTAIGLKPILAARLGAPRARAPEIRPRGITASNGSTSRPSSRPQKPARASGTSRRGWSQTAVQENPRPVRTRGRRRPRTHRPAFVLDGGRLAHPLRSAGCPTKRHPPGLPATIQARAAGRPRRFGSMSTSQSSTRISRNTRPTSDVVVADRAFALGEDH